MSTVGYRRVLVAACTMTFDQALEAADRRARTVTTRGLTSEQIMRMESGRD